MPPKGGFIFPKFRLTTLLPKGFSTNQIWFGFFAALGYGFFSAKQYKTKENAQNLLWVEQIDAQAHVIDVLYGAPQLGSRDGKRRRGNMFDGLWYKEPRATTFAQGVALSEGQQIIQQWREATSDPLVAPYQVCYGPSNYSTPHTCNQYCISKQEVLKAKKDLKVSFPKNQFSQLHQ
jgi:hypothetical protein